MMNAVKMHSRGEYYLRGEKKGQTSPPCMLIMHVYLVL